ncbi:MAG: histidine phosphatase family protein [Eubacteriales bacterium]|nr:histidine phosphatase family protein [Eubacteriales bacterium]
MKLYLLRHGQTDMNIAHRLQGSTNTPLNATGEAQARALGEEIKARGLHFDRIYCSPLQRAVRTAELATGRDPSVFRMEPSIEEMHMGDLETHSYEELGPTFMETFFHDPAQFVPRGDGETFPELIERVSGFLETLRKELPGEHILAVSHGAAIHCMLAAVEHTPMKDLWKRKVDNCSLITLETEGGPYRLIGR